MRRWYVLSYPGHCVYPHLHHRRAGRLASIVVALLLQGCGVLRPPRAATPNAAPLSADTSETTGTAVQPLTGRVRRCTQGRIAHFACASIELLAYLPRSLLGAGGGDLWGWTDSATGREFLILAGQHPAFVEVTDPVQPTYLGSLSLSGGSVKVYQHYALVASGEPDQPGLLVFDLTQLRHVPTPPVTFTVTPVYATMRSTHTLALNPATGFAYGNDGQGPCGYALHMIDVRVPTQPVFAGCYLEPVIGSGPTRGAIHDSECVLYRGPDRRYQGREICVAAGEHDGVAVADVTDKPHPTTLSIIRYPDIAYAHQGWFSADQRYFYLDDEFDEANEWERVCRSIPACQDSVRQHTRHFDIPTRTHIFDLAELDDPVVLPDFVNPASRAVDHNLYIQGHYMYQGNYSGGLRIIDLADPVHLKEVGYLTNIGEAWGTYPFLKHSTVAVSTDQGLFLARLRSR